MCIYIRKRKNIRKIKGKKEKFPKEFAVKDGVLTRYSGREKYVEIPEGIREIGKKAFWGCESLERIYIPESVAKIDFPSFTDNFKLVVYAPEGSFAEEYCRKNFSQY